jgi:hypothetical protein
MAKMVLILADHEFLELALREIVKETSLFTEDENRRYTFQNSKDIRK